MTRRSINFRLDLRFYFSEFLLGSKAILALQELLRTMAPEWSSKLRVWGRGRGPIIEMESPGSMQRAVAEEASKRGKLFHELVATFSHLPGQARTLGSAEFRGADPALILLVDIDEEILPRIGTITTWGNSISIQICRSRVGAVDATLWARDFFERMCDRSSPAYAHGEMLDEFWSKNIVSDADGTGAVGVDFSSGLPGLYWLNLFGPRYVDLLRRDRLLSCPAFTCAPLGPGVLVSLSRDPRDWSTPEYKARELAVRNHLGPDHFFSKDRPGAA